MKCTVSQPSSRTAERRTDGLAAHYFAVSLAPTCCFTSGLLVFASFGCGPAPVTSEDGSDTQSTVDDTADEGGEEECGDGVHRGNERCDDGNLIDGDGCNSACLPSGEIVWRTPMLENQDGLVPRGDPLVADGGEIMVAKEDFISFVVTGFSRSSADGSSPGEIELDLLVPWSTSVPMFGAMADGGWMVYDPSSEAISKYDANWSQQYAIDLQGFQLLRGMTADGLELLAVIHPGPAVEGVELVRFGA